MIIGLTGKKGSGKDTVGRYLVSKYDFEQWSFATKLKESVAALFGIPLGDIELGKAPTTNSVVTVAIAGAAKGFTFREFLQRYGTESHRDIFGENFWVDQLFPPLGQFESTLDKEARWHGKKIVITDVRFFNEGARILEYGGRIWQIHRFDNNEDTHVSEDLSDLQELVSYHLENDGTFEELYEQVEDALAQL